VVLGRGRGREVVVVRLWKVVREGRERFVNRGHYPLFLYRRVPRQRAEERMIPYSLLSAVSAADASRRLMMLLMLLHTHGWL
jgi:hypothetical protein